MRVFIIKESNWIIKKRFKKLNHWLILFNSLTFKLYIFKLMTTSYIDQISICSLSVIWKFIYKLLYYVLLWSETLQSFAQIKNKT